jgi:hypothetical protein
VKVFGDLYITGYEQLANAMRVRLFFFPPKPYFSVQDSKTLSATSGTQEKKMQLTPGV